MYPVHVSHYMYLGNLQCRQGRSRRYSVYPGLNANEIQIPYDKHHKVSSLVKSHQNTHNSVNYEVIWKCEITLPNMKYLS